MISESFFYKKELNAYAIKINLILKRNSFKEKHLYELEKLMFVSSYLIRKLNESNKISDEVMTEPIYVDKVRLNENEFIDSLNNHNISTKYNWKSISNQSLSISIIINYIIHSFVFQLVWDEDINKPQAIAFNSDRSKSTLFILSIENFLKLIENIYTDDIQSLKYEKILKFLPSGEPDWHQPRVPLLLKRGDYCPPINKFQKNKF